MATKKKAESKVKLTAEQIAEQEAIQKVFGNMPSEKPKKTTGKKEREEIELNAPYDTLINVAIVENALKGVKESLLKLIKPVVVDIFTDKIREELKQPDTFAAVCGDASGSFQFKKSGAGFSEKTADFLNSKEIPFETEEKTEELLVLNPAILRDQAILGKLALVLSKCEGFEGAVIKKVESVKKFQFTDATLAGIAQKCSDEEQKDLFKELSTIAMGPDSKLAGKNAKDQSTVDKALANLAKVGVLKYQPEKE